MVIYGVCNKSRLLSTMLDCHDSLFCVKIDLIVMKVLVCFKFYFKYIS